jgi:hypothetical protein
MRAQPQASIFIREMWASQVTSVSVVRVSVPGPDSEGERVDGDRDAARAPLVGSRRAMPGAGPLILQAAPFSRTGTTWGVPLRRGRRVEGLAGPNPPGRGLMWQTEVIGDAKDRYHSLGGRNHRGGRP